MSKLTWSTPTHHGQQPSVPPIFQVPNVPDWPECAEVPRSNGVQQLADRSHSMSSSLGITPFDEKRTEVHRRRWSTEVVRPVSSVRSGGNNPRFEAERSGTARMYGLTLVHDSVQQVYSLSVLVGLGGNNPRFGKVLAITDQTVPNCTVRYSVRRVYN